MLNQFLLDVVILAFVLRYIMSIKIKVELKRDKLACAAVATAHGRVTQEENFKQNSCYA